MNTPLQHLTDENQMTVSQLAALGELEDVEEVEHIHMPNPSFWPLIAGLGILIAIIGFLFIDTTAWIAVIGVIWTLVGILGWAIEDPLAPREEEIRPSYPEATYEEVQTTGKHTPFAEQVLQEAQDIVDHLVVIGSIPWSAHPVSVEIDDESPEGVVLALYGKVELEAQSREVEDALRGIPGVSNVKNFIVAEDALLNAVNARIEKLRADGKLEGASNISVLVENYIVSLYGYTPTDEMKRMIEREIIRIPGVRVVVNHIGLNEDIPGNLGRTNNKVGSKG